ncbi:MAG: MFS transporter [Rubrobacteraceae bacterium]
MPAEATERDLGLDPRAKHALRGAFLGFFVDMFDIYLPIIVLAPAIAYFVSPDLSAGATSIVLATIFAVALVGRPLGAAIFGHFADTIGRKPAAMIAVGGFGVMSVLMAVLPGYQQWGIVAIVLFILFRFIDGIFVGGEYTAAIPLAMEYSPKAKRGLYSGIINSGFPLSYASISLITMLLLFLMPSEGVNSAYVQWGWRIPFFIGAGLAFAFVAYFYYSVSESELWQRSERDEAPIKTLFRGASLKNFLQVFLLMSGLWLSLQTVAAILPGILSNTVGLTGSVLTITLVIAYTLLIPVNVAAGMISQKIGRKTFFIVMSVIMASLATFLYYLLIRTAPDSFLATLVLVTAIIVLVDAPFAIIPAYVNERFHVGVRASGYGIGYSLAVMVPAFYAFYQAGLATFMPSEYTVLVLLIVGALLIFIGALWGPETRDVDFAGDVAETAAGSTS